MLRVRVRVGEIRVRIGAGVSAGLGFVGSGARLNPFWLGLG